MSEDWDPPPGMLKCRCAGCGHAFATKRRTQICPNCLLGKSARANTTRAVGGSTFDAPALPSAPSTSIKPVWTRRQ